ncbi:MAG: toxin-antitoxin system HicB family antitoxin, partial [Firmicutes bacterium HGW-Firmicutes-8]
ENNEEYSGKFTLRLPKSLHKELSIAAQRDDISLNQYILALLSLNYGRTVKGRVSIKRRSKSSSSSQ